MDSRIDFIRVTVPDRSSGNININKLFLIHLLFDLSRRIIGTTIVEIVRQTLFHLISSSRCLHEKL